MNGGRSDASTSTDDVKSRPLCLFYFTHPFGVLSPEPPTLAAAPAHIARAFVNMEPVSPFTMWGSTSDESYNTATSSTRPSYELGNATVHAAPVDLLSVTRARKCTLDFGARRDSLSSSLFSSDMWFNSSSSCRSTEYPRRLVPYNKILPPLRLPSPRDSSNLDSSDELWPRKCLNPEKFSLPPIEMPAVKVKIVRSKKCIRSSGADESCSGDSAAAAARDVRARRRVGVSKPRRAARPPDLRRLLAMLMRRALAGGVSVTSGASGPWRACRGRVGSEVRCCGAGDARGAMALLDKGPNLETCCYSVRLRQAVMLIAILGMVLGVLYLAAYSYRGARALHQLGAPCAIKHIALRYAHGVLGVLIFAAHALLLGAACYRNYTLCELYVWSMLVVTAAALFVNVALVVAAYLAHLDAYGCLLLVATGLALALALYFILVVVNFSRTLPGPPPSAAPAIHV